MKRAVVDLSAAALQTESQLCQHLDRVHNDIWKVWRYQLVASVILELYTTQCLDTHATLVPDQISRGPVQLVTLNHFETS